MLEQLTPRNRNIALVLVGAVIFWFFWSVRAVVNPLLIGYVLAFIAQPLLLKLRHQGLSHGFSAALVFGAAFLLTALIGVLLFFQLRDLAGDIQAASVAAAAAPIGDPGVVALPPAGALEPAPTQSGLTRAWNRLSDWVERHLGDEVLPSGWPSSQEALGMLRGYLIDSVGFNEGGASAGLSAARNAFLVLKRLLDWTFGFGTLALLVPLYTYFLLFRIDSLHAWVRNHLPKRYRAQWADMGSKIGDILSSFLRGRLVIAMLKGLVLSLALLIAGVPYSFLIGLVSGALSLVPFIGALIGYVLGLSASFLTFPFLTAILIASLIFLAAELLEGYVLIPRILGKSLGLSELAVIFSITAGGAFAGLFGVIVAVPVAAAVKVMFLEFVEPALRQFANESPSEPTRFQ